MEPNINNIELLKLLLVLAGSLIGLLLLVLAFFLRKQITVSEDLTTAVNRLTIAVSLIEKEQSERDPKTEERLNNHSERLKLAENRLTILETIVINKKI